MDQRLRIRVDRALCVGNGMCLVTAPGVFEHDEHRQSVAVDPGAAPAETILRAAESCPTGTITVHDDGSGERLFPTGDRA